jgi:hypothetical protein
MKQLWLTKSWSWQKRKVIPQWDKPLILGRGSFFLPSLLTHLFTFFFGIIMEKRMSAQNILLTHFSARYTRIPATEKNSPSVIFPAFDHLDMSIGTMWKMRHYIPILEGNVSETSEDEDYEQEAPQRPEVDVDVDWDHQNP